MTKATDHVNWNEQGLVAAIAQDAQSREILMMAWMNAEALEKTISSGRAVYWSRSRAKLWHKGEESGHHQDVKEIRLDCDEDVIILLVEQHGGIACHTGRGNCFYRKLENGTWTTIADVIKDPAEMYGEK